MTLFGYNSFSFPTKFAAILIDVSCHDYCTFTQQHRDCRGTDIGCAARQQHNLAFKIVCPALGLTETRRVQSEIQARDDGSGVTKARRSFGAPGTRARP